MQGQRYQRCGPAALRVYALPHRSPNDCEAVLRALLLAFICSDAHLADIVVFTAALVLQLFDQIDHLRTITYMYYYVNLCTFTK